MQSYFMRLSLERGNFEMIEISYELINRFIYFYSQLHFAMASQYPLLPGFKPTQEFKDNFRKVSAQKQENNRDLNKV